MNLEALRVVFVSDAIVSRNGVGTYYQDLVSHLTDHVGSVELIAPREHHPDSYQGISFAIPGDKTQRLYFPRYRRVIARLREFKPHVIVFPTLGPYTVFCLRYARRMGVPVCIGKHTDFEKLAEIYCHRLTVKVCQKILRWISTSVISSGNAIITNDIDDKTELGHLAPVHLVGTPISKLFLDGELVPPNCQLQRVLFLGRLGPEKNIELVLEAARQLSNIQFVIAGDGPLRGLVEEASVRLANLMYLGWIDRAAVVETIDRTDLLVLPSILESFGSVALEAMSRARNVLVSRNCGIKNWPILAKQLFYWEESEQLWEAIRRVGSLNPQERQGRAWDGRQAAVAVNESAIEDWLNVFREVTQQSLPSTPLAPKPNGKQTLDLPATTKVG